MSVSLPLVSIFLGILTGFSWGFFHMQQGLFLVLVSAVLYFPEIPWSGMWMWMIPSLSFWRRKKKEKSASLSVVSNSLQLYRPWNSPHQNTGVGSHSLLQGIFPMQGLNPSLPHCRLMSHKGSPRILEWVAYPISRGSSLPRNQIRLSCIASGLFTSWATWEAQYR